MDQQGHDYAATAANAMAYAQQQQQQQQVTNMQPQQQQHQQYGFHPQQYPTPHFMPPHPSMQQLPYPHHMQQQPQLHSHPPHMHPLLPQQSPPPFPPHLSPHLVPPPFQGTYDSAPPPPAPPPSDPDLQKRIDKLVEYVIKNGPEFEIMIREKEQANPAYSFLFGGEGHNYYRYKLFLSTHPHSGPFNPPFPPSSMPMMHPPPHPMMNPAAPASMLGASPIHQPPFAPFYDPQHLHQHPLPLGAHVSTNFDHPSKAFRGSLPPEVAMELNNMLNSLNGTKESIKGAKVWFMQRAAFAPALAEALRDRVFALDDSERQLHIIYLANDILFDSLQRRANPRDLDNEALAFKPVLGSMLARIYHSPQNKDEIQSRLQKILQFWASKEVYDQDTISTLEGDMLGARTPSSFSGSLKESFGTPPDPKSVAGFPQVPAHGAPQWQADRQSLTGQEHPDKQVLPVMQPNQQFVPNSVPTGPLLASMPASSSVQPAYQQTAPQANVGEKLPPYPLFPPGLIPGMVRKMQIGSGVPYSPLSPLDIPTVIPPSNVSPKEILERVSKFFKEIGEVNPLEGPMGSHSDDEEYIRGRESPVRKGGACIPPPANLVFDSESGMYADGSVDQKGSGRLGLGAPSDSNEPSQYDDVYTSYRKQRSTNYHSSMSTRTVTR